MNYFNFMTYVHFMVIQTVLLSYPSGNLYYHLVQGAYGGRSTDTYCKDNSSYNFVEMIKRKNIRNAKKIATKNIFTTSRLQKYHNIYGNNAYGVNVVCEVDHASNNNNNNVASKMDRY